MTPIETKANSFLLAFKSLPQKEKITVLKNLLSDKEFREDILDIAVFEERENEPSRPLEEYLKQKK